MAYSNDDYKYLDSSFQKIMHLLFNVAEATKGKVGLHAELFESLVAKTFFHAATMFELRKGTPIMYSTKDHPMYWDFPSAFVIARTILETYITLYGLFFQPKLQDDYTFDISAWVIKGIALRKDWNVSDLDAESLESHQQTLADLATWEAAIAKTNRFKNLTINQRESLLKGTYTGDVKFVDRAQEAGLEGEFARRLYSYYSGYTHADSICGAQIFHSRTVEDQKNLCYVAIGYAIVVLANLAMSYAYKWPECNTFLDQNPELVKLAEHWTAQGRERL